MRMAIALLGAAVSGIAVTGSTWAQAPATPAPAQAAPVMIVIPANAAGEVVRTVTALADGQECATVDVSRGEAALPLGLPGQPEACGRDGAEITFVDGNGNRLFVTLTARVGVTQTLTNLAPVPPGTGAPLPAVTGGGPRDSASSGTGVWAVAVLLLAAIAAMAGRRLVRRSPPAGDDRQP